MGLALLSFGMPHISRATSVMTTSEDISLSLTSVLPDILATGNNLPFLPLAAIEHSRWRYASHSPVAVLSSLGHTSL